MKGHYQIEYWNRLWRDWIAFDQLFYNTEEQAQRRIDEYKESVPDIKTRIIHTTILTSRPKVSKKKEAKIITEPVTRQPH